MSTKWTGISAAAGAVTPSSSRSAPLPRSAPRALQARVAPGLTHEDARGGAPAVERGPSDEPGAGVNVGIRELRLRLPHADGAAGERLALEALELVRGRLGEIRSAGGALEALELSVPWSTPSTTAQKLAESILRSLGDSTNSSGGGDHA